MLQRCPCMATVFRSKVSCLFGKDPNIKLLLLKILDIFFKWEYNLKFSHFTKIVSHILIKYSSKKKKKKPLINSELTKCIVGIFSDDCDF